MGLALLGCFVDGLIGCCQIQCETDGFVIVVCGRVGFGGRARPAQKNES
jgi:hypothetical protein